MAAYLPTEAAGRASRSPVRCWQVISSGAGGGLESGEQISLPGYSAEGWYVAPARSTVLAALLSNGLFEGIERARAMEEAVDRAMFEVPWWYRTTFSARGSGRTTLRLDGVTPKADLWVNGTQVATAEETAGSYTVSSWDVSGLVRPGANALALQVYPGSPLEDLSIGWVDWAQWPPDNNMGVWRDVVVERTGDVRLGSPAVTPELSLPSLRHAELTLSVEVANLSGTSLVAELRGVVTGHSAKLHLARDVRLVPAAKETVTFSPVDTPALRLEDPEVWWPVGEGAQPVYDLELAVSVDGLVSDQRSTSFGIRSVTSYVAGGGGRRFVVNGRELQIVGAGWAPDLFLRYDPDRMAKELGYALDMGLNTLRLEGKLENEEFFEMTDAAGLMVLPGWECCTKWEQEKREEGQQWSEHDFVVAGRSMASEAVLLRNHPSVIGFLIGSDFAPPPRTASVYVEALQANGWSLPIVSSAAAEGTEMAGPSGMKMTGPYAYVPPLYWYSRDPARGGAVGFNSETSAGGTIPRLASLRRMLSEAELEALWSEPEAKQFHAGPPSDFDNLAVFHRALAGRYGKPTSLADFSRKAQLANYEAVRAQFEAYLSRGFAEQPATGVVYWMFNSPWPSLDWQLYDWYLDTGGAYFGAKKANEEVHAMYAYDTGAVQVVNRRPERAGPFELSVQVRDLSGAVVSENDYKVDEVAARGVTRVADAVVPWTNGPTYFLAIYLASPGSSTPSRNVYWLSTTPDVVDWEAAGPWFHTPQSQFADLTGLERLAEARIDAEVELGPTTSGARTARCRLRNVSPAGTPAVGLHASVVAAGSTGPVAPVRWSDNDLTLFGGDEVELVASYPTVPGVRETVEIEGFNLTSPLRSPVFR